MPTLATTPYTLSYNGLSIGAGTAYDLQAMTGFDDLPEVRKADQRRSADHGAFLGIDYHGGRTVEFAFWIPASSLADYESRLGVIQAAINVQPLVELPLLYALGDAVQYQILCRPSKRDIPRTLEWAGTTGLATIQMIASNPRKFAPSVTSAVTSLAAISGGMTFNATFPLSFGAVGGGGTLTLTNAGNFQTALNFSIAGPVANPIIDNLTTGQSLLFGITLASGDTLVIANAGTSVASIVLNGTASRYNALLAGSAPLQQFGLPGGLPGPCAVGTSQQIRYRNNGAGSASQLTVTYQSAWV